jgi:hypothetical protein
LKVSKWRKLTPKVEREIVALLRAGVGHYRTAKLTRVPQLKVQEIMAAHGIVHKTGGNSCAEKEPELHAQIVEAVKRRDTHMLALAKTFNVGKSVVRKIVDEVLQPTGRFIGGPVERLLRTSRSDGRTM